MLELLDYLHLLKLIRVLKILNIVLVKKSNFNQAINQKKENKKAFDNIYIYQIWTIWRIEWNQNKQTLNHTWSMISGNVRRMASGLPTWGRNRSTAAALSAAITAAAAAAAPPPPHASWISRRIYSRACRESEHPNPRCTDARIPRHTGPDCFQDALPETAAAVAADA